jgi:hypothetical protein
MMVSDACTIDIINDASNSVIDASGSITDDSRVMLQSLKIGMIIRICIVQAIVAIA